MVEPIMQDIQATPPLTNPDVDLRDFSYMPLDVSHLRDSDFAKFDILCPFDVKGCKKQSSTKRKGLGVA